MTQTQHIAEAIPHRRIWILVERGHKLPLYEAFESEEKAVARRAEYGWTKQKCVPVSLEVS